MATSIGRRARNDTVTCGACEQLCHYDEFGDVIAPCRCMRSEEITVVAKMPKRQGSSNVSAPASKARR